MIAALSPRLHETRSDGGNAQLPADLEEALTEMLRKHKYLLPVTDLATMDDEKGIYVMVLDGYRQAYIGQAWDIRKRIKRHWSGSRLPATCLGLSQGFRTAEKTQTRMQSKRPHPSRRRNNEQPDREISSHKMLEGANKHGNGHWKGRVYVAQNNETRFRQYCWVGLHAPC